MNRGRGGRDDYDNRRHDDRGSGGYNDRGSSRGNDDRRDNRGGGGYDNRRDDRGNNRGHDDRGDYRGHDDRGDYRGHDDRGDYRGGQNRGYDDRRDNRGGYGRNDQGYNRGGGSSDYRSGESSDTQYGGSTYSTHSGVQCGGRDGYNGRGAGRGAGRGGQQDDLNRRMGDMNIRGGGRGGDNTYSSRSRGGGSIVHRPHDDPRSIGNLAGSAQHPNMSVPKKKLIHTTQEFAERPEGWVYDSSLGTKTELTTNHALVHLPEETVKLWAYNIEVLENRKPVTKREKSGPLFYKILEKDRTRQFPNPSQFIFNDVNQLWSTTQLKFAEGRVGDNRAQIVYKHTGRVDFGKTIREDQDKQLLSTLVDAIATARVRNPNSKNYTVFKRCMFLTGVNANEVMDNQICVPIRYGLDARLGISVGVRINLRAGITACYDVAHTMFSRPGYPVIRLLCELINAGPITDNEFENTWDDQLQRAVFTESNRKEMDRIFKKMKLRYSQDIGIIIGEDGSEQKPRLLHQDLSRGKAFKYHELTHGPASKTTFKDEAKKTWTIPEYFLSKNIRLRYPNLPCFVKKPAKKDPVFIAFPMEFVTFIENPTRFEGFSSERVKAELIRETAYEVHERRALLHRIIGQESIANLEPVVNNEDRIMRQHGLTIENKPISVKATVLPVPTVVYGEGSKFQDVEHLGEWKAVLNDPPRKVLDGAIYVRNKDKDAPKLKKRLLGSVLQVASPVNNSTQMEYNDDGYHHLMRALEMCGQPVCWENEQKGQAAIQGTFAYCQSVSEPGEIYGFFEKLKNNIDDKYKQSDDEVIIPFVLVVFQVRCTTLGNNQPNLFNDYNFIKYLADNEQGIYTQGILVESLNSIDRNIMQCKLTRLVVEKILGKVGTTHRMLERNGDHKSWTKLTDPKAPTLLLGVDVSHPSPRDKDLNDIRKLSVASVVGNIDINCTEYRSSSRIQECGEERIFKFCEEVQARLNDFIQHNDGLRPKHIVLYRDGIAEGEFQRTLYEERMEVENACLEIDTGYRPTITYIVVTKRHHTRFFLKNEQEGHAAHGFNVLPGTLVEDDVTTNDYHDFFLTTQIGQMGVARPTHYYVLYNTWPKLKVSFWPTVTHALTYMFCRTTSTVALPAPVLYAHLAAKRAKECLDGAWTAASYRGGELNIDNFEMFANLIKAINVNQSLDGMTFV